MHSCYDAYLFYGFSEGNRDQILDSEWLYEEYDGVISIGALDVVKNYIGEACYGVYCSINQTTGKIEVDSEEKKLIEKLNLLIY